jgi:hypothetical protein
MTSPIDLKYALSTTYNKDYKDASSSSSSSDDDDEKVSIVENEIRAFCALPHDSNIMYGYDPTAWEEDDRR